jgi:hypothetical protein
MIHTLKNMIGSGTDWTKVVGPLSKTIYWQRTVPLPCPPSLIERFQDAWAVLTGRAYAVQWPETGDLEKILGNGLGEIRE